MGAQGIRFRLMPPRVSYKGGVLTAAVDDDSQLTFTVDGAQPQPYTGPIRTERPELYLFRSSYRSGRSPEVGAPAYYRTLKPAVKITTSMGESNAVPLRTCRGVPRYRPHGAHLPEGRLDPLRFRRAARVPRTGGAYG